ncbi:hypothetical protein GCK32_018044, partial [Trichostrongylus colubriformis]
KLHHFDCVNNDYASSFVCLRPAAVSSSCTYRVAGDAVLDQLSKDMYGYNIEDLLKFKPSQGNVNKHEQAMWEK